MHKTEMSAEIKITVSYTNVKSMGQYVSWPPRDITGLAESVQYSLLTKRSAIELFLAKAYVLSVSTVIRKVSNI